MAAKISAPELKRRKSILAPVAFSKSTPRTFDQDGPLSEIPESNARKSARERFVTLAKRDNLKLRDNLGLPRPENQFFKSPKGLSGERAKVAPALRPSENH
jgi:hypothetical protein